MHFMLSPKVVFLFLFNRYINTFKIKPPQRIKTFEELPIKETLAFDVSDSWPSDRQLIICLFIYFCVTDLHKENLGGVLLLCSLS